MCIRDSANSELVVEYRLAHGMADPDKIPDIYALGPSGFQAPLKVDKVAAGHYRGRLPIGQNQGLFRVRPVADSRAFPEVGFYRQEDEMTEYGNNVELLKQIAAATGGRYNPSARQVFDAGNRSIRATMEIWPGLLALALLLNLAELVLRKWKMCIRDRLWANKRGKSSGIGDYLLVRVVYVGIDIASACAD